MSDTGSQEISKQPYNRELKPTEQKYQAPVGIVFYLAQCNSEAHRFERKKDMALIVIIKY